MKKEEISSIYLDFESNTIYNEKKEKKILDFDLNKRPPHDFNLNRLPEEGDELFEEEVILPEVNEEIRKEARNMIKFYFPAVQFFEDDNSMKTQLQEEEKPVESKMEEEGPMLVQEDKEDSGDI
ncbi:hypothetical protein M5689_008656 [Euphorbia peplus]|nr:hypothetical protein M5689_008656 [Euphorbia peplus]